MGAYLNEAMRRGLTPEEYEAEQKKKKAPVLSQSDPRGVVQQTLPSGVDNTSNQQGPPPEQVDPQKYQRQMEQKNVAGSAAEGAAAGSAAGPWGAVAGAALEGGAAYLDNKQKQKSPEYQLAKEEVKAAKRENKIKSTAFEQGDNVDDLVYGINAKHPGRGPLRAVGRLVRGGLTKRAQGKGKLTKEEVVNLAEGGSGNLTQLAANEAEAQNRRNMMYRTGPLRRGMAIWLGV